MRLALFPSVRSALALLPLLAVLSLCFGAPGDDPADVVATLKGHKEAVFGIAFTPEGNHLVTGSGDPSVKVWDARTGKELKSFAGPNGHKQLVLQVAVSPDGASFATAGSDNSAKVWDFPTNKHMRLFAQGAEAQVVAAAPDGSRVAGGGKDGHVKIWSTADGKLLFDFADHAGPVTGLAFSADGKTLVSAGADRTLRFRATIDGKALAGYGAHSGPVNAVTLSPNGVVAYSAGADGTLKFWSLPPVASKTVATFDAPVAALSLSPDGASVLAAVGKEARLSTVAVGQSVRALTGPAAALGAVALAPNGTLAVGGTADRQLFVWQTKDGKVLSRTLAHNGAVSAVAFNSASTQALSGGREGALKLWAVPAVPPRIFTHPDALRAAVLSADGKHLFTAGADKIVRAWALASPKMAERQFTGHTGPINALAASPDGKLLASGGDAGNIRFWDRTKGDQTALIGAHAGPVVSLAFSPTGQQVLSASVDGTVALRQVPAPTSKGLFAHAGAVTSATLSADGAYLLTGSADKQVRRWALATGKLDKTYTGPTLGVLAVAHAPALDRVAAGSADRSLWVWTASTAKELKKFVNLPGAVQAVAFSPDGRFLAAGLSDKTARLFDLTSGKEVKQFAHTGPVQAIAFSPKGDRVLSAGADGTVQAWGVADGAVKMSFKHGAAVHALGLSRDGTSLVSGGADKAVRVWALSDGKLLSTLTTPSAVQGVSLSPDGKQLAVAGADGRARVYGMDGALQESLAHEGPVTAVAFADAKRVLTASADKTARVWHLSLLWQAKHVGPVRQAAFNARGDRIVSGGDDKFVRIWGPVDGKAIRALAHDAPVLAVGVSADGTRVVSAGADRKIKVWDLAKVGKGADVPVTVIDLPAVPQAVGLSPNGLRVAVGLVGKEEHVHVYDAVSGQELLQVSEPGAARSLAFLPDNRTLLLAGADRTARLIDVHVLTAFEAHAGGVNSVAFHNDGVRALSAGADKTVKLWNLTTGKLERTFGPLDEPVSAAVFSRDGLQVGAAAGKTVRVWNILDGKVALSLPHPTPALSLSFNSDRSRIATAGADGWVRVWDAAGKFELQSFPHSGPVRSVAFHPFNNAVLFAAGDDKSVTTHTLNIVRRVAAGSPVRSLVALANSTHLLSGDEEGKVKLWNVNNGLVERTFTGPVGAGRVVAASRNNLLVAATGPEDRVRVFNFADGKVLAIVKAPAAVRALAFSPNNQALAAACADGTVQTWDVVFAPGQPLAAEFGKALQSHKHDGPALDVTFPANALAGSVFFSAGDKSVRQWKLASEAPTRTFNGGGIVSSVAFDPKGERLATGAADGRLRIYDIAKGVQIKDVPAHVVANTTEIYCLAWSADGKELVTGGNDRSVKLWDATSGKLVRDFPAYKLKVSEKGHQAAVLAVAFAPDGKHLVSAGMDRSIKVWRIADGSVVRDLNNKAFKAGMGDPTPAHPGNVYALRFTADGKHLVSAGGAPGLRGYVGVWDWPSGTLKSGREMGIGTVFAVSLSADGKLMALGTGGSLRHPELSQGLVLKMPGAK